MKKPVSIFCDMDGVVADFFPAAEKLMKSIVAGEEKIFINYEVEKIVNENIDFFNKNINSELYLHEKFMMDSQRARDLLFTAIGCNPGLFFSSLIPLEDGINELWPFINSLGIPVNMLTAPIDQNVSFIGTPAIEGKTAWARKWLKPNPKNVYITPARMKYKYALSVVDGDLVPHILIDDKFSTIDAWNKAGGVGILHVPGESMATIEAIKNHARIS